MILAVLAIVIGSSFQFGYHIGCINSSKEYIEEFIRETSFADNPERFNKTRAWIWASIVSAFPFGAIFGSLIAATLADTYGRKTTIFFNNVPAAIAGALMTFAYPFKMWYLLLIGRLIIGVNAGISSGVVSTFLTELSPDNLRGTLGSCNQLFLTIAILFSNVLSFKVIFGSETRWQYIFGLTFFPIISQLILLKFCPESPRYTLVFERDEAQAEKDLIMLREKPDVHEEIEEIKQEAAQRESESKVTFRALFTSELRWATFIAVFLMFMQQMTGINAAMYYSNDIFQSAGLVGDQIVLATCAMMLANVLMTVASTWLVDHPRFGRRSLLLTGMAGMFFTSIAVVVALVLIGKKTYVTESRVAAIVFMVLFVIAFATGPGSIPWFYVSELFASNARASATAIACAVNWTMNFAIGLLFPPIHVRGSLNVHTLYPFKPSCNYIPSLYG
ncbi:unnamed protein product [Toxocara canis]|uniref:Major facilitator superfamily (MFS) profile domain-containing protein n=1 Tax=Toxocara canis TaxID=6265 RepID=A0A3P7FCK8_TOXCA|nr:unnamed protein product [Toxocara canis]